MQALSHAPQTLAKVLDDGFRLMARGYLPALGLSAFGMIGSVLMMAARLLTDDPETFRILIFLLVPAVLFFSLASAGAVIAHYAAIADGRTLPFAQAFRLGMRRGPRLLLAALFYMVAVVVGFVLLIVPGVAISLSASLFPYVIMLEDKGPIAALTRSHRLVWGGWWRTMMAASVVMIIYFIFVLATQITLAVALTLSGADFETVQIVSDLLGAVGGAIGAPLMTSALLVVFHDLRLRKDGADLAARLDRLLTAG